MRRPNSNGLPTNPEDVRTLFDTVIMANWKSWGCFGMIQAVDRYNSTCDDRHKLDMPNVWDVPNLPNTVVTASQVNKFRKWLQRFDPDQDRKWFMLQPSSCSDVASKLKYEERVLLGVQAFLFVGPNPSEPPVIIVMDYRYDRYHHGQEKDIDGNRKRFKGEEHNQQPGQVNRNACWEHRYGGPSASEPERRRTVGFADENSNGNGKLTTHYNCLDSVFPFYPTDDLEVPDPVQQPNPVLRRSARLAAKAKQKKAEAAGQPNGGHATARPRRTCAAKPPGFYKV